MSKQSLAADAAVFFDREMAEKYDERNGQLSPIADNLHFLLRLALKSLPASSQILCVGVGTGADILALAAAFPGWRFVGVDPSADMLDVCRTKLEGAGLQERCKLVHGDISSVSENRFDAAISLFVAHFVSRTERPNFYSEIKGRIKPGGYFVSAEICFELNSPQFPAMLENWKQIQALMGATPESLEQLPHVLRNTLSVLSPEETESLALDAGFDQPTWFFQAFMVRGWYAKG